MSSSLIVSGANDVASAPDLCAIVIPLIGENALANCLDRLPLSALECIVVLRGRAGTRVEQSHTNSILPRFKFPGNGRGVLIHRVAGKALIAI